MNRHQISFPFSVDTARMRMVPVVEVVRAAAVEGLHARRQIGFGSLHEEGFVVRHDRERM